MNQIDSCERGLLAFKLWNAEDLASAFPFCCGGVSSEVSGFHPFHINHIVGSVWADDLSLAVLVLMRSWVVFVSDHWIEVAAYRGGVSARG